MAGLSTFDAFKNAGVTSGTRVLSDEELGQLQAALLAMLRDIDRACKQASVEYMLAYGSCLGAVRHSGFIPWDDDLDIAMLRGDYEIFESLFDDLLGDGYVLQAPGRTEGYDLAFPRIRKRGTLLRNRDDFFSTQDCGIYIDLFVMESVPDNAVLRVGHGFVSLGLGFLYSCRRFAKYGKHYLRLVDGNEGTSKVFKIKISIGRLLSFWSVGAWTKTWYNWNAICRNSSSEYLTVPAGPRHYFGEIQHRNELFPTRTCTFESLIVGIPSDSATYLTKLYGQSYMVLPPKEKRERHIVLEFDLRQSCTRMGV